MAATVRKGIKISGVCLFLLYLTGLVYFLFLRGRIWTERSGCGL